MGYSGAAPVSKVSTRLSTQPTELVCHKYCDAGVNEASDVVAMTGEMFLVVGDKSESLALIDADLGVQRVKLPGLPSTSGLEAVAFDPSREHLFVISEEKNKLFRYEMEFEPELSATLEKVFDLDKWQGGSKNKGVEGLTYVPLSASPTGSPILLIAKEGDPKELAYVDDGGGTSPRSVRIDPRLDALVSDFSGVTAHPSDGRIFLVSQESAMLCVCRLVKQGDGVSCNLEQAYTLVNHKGHALERVEGVACDEHGKLFVLLEDKCELLSVEL